MVASLARPGGNVTGLSNQGTDLAAKRLEILREVVPGLRRLAVMVNAEYSGGVTERVEIDTAARTLGLDVVSLPIRNGRGYRVRFRRSLGTERRRFMSTGDPLTNSHRLRIATFSLAAHLPTMLAQRDYRRSGRSDVLWSEFP